MGSCSICANILATFARWSSFHQTSGAKLLLKQDEQFFCILCEYDSLSMWTIYNWLSMFVTGSFYDNEDDDDDDA